MRILLDNCVDHRAGGLFVGHEVTHARDLGWENFGNGELLAAASKARFAVMVTVDKNIRYQQNLDRLPITVLEINASDVRLQALRKMAAQMHAALGYVERFRFLSVDHEGQIEMLAKRLRSEHE